MSAAAGVRDDYDALILRGLARTSEDLRHTAAHWLRLSEGGSQSMFGLLQHGKQGRFSMAAAGQPRSDFLGDDLPRTARKSEEAAQTRQLLALPVIRDGVLRFKAGGAAALVTRKAPAKTPRS